jgi:GxxExxY protein
VDEAQLINYLTATEMNRGLLINFGSERLEFMRRVRDY